MPDDRAQPNPVPVLAEIVEHKRREVAEAKAQTPLESLKERIEELGRPRNFFGAVTNRPSIHHPAIIAEIKRKSPSAGLIRPEFEGDGFDPVAIARRYHAGGAAALSCLTDERYFGGRLEYIHRVRDAVPLPVLRKDFIIDPYQVWESRAAGADAILLIAECLTESELVDLLILARELQLTTLVETHDMDNLLRVRPHVGFPARSYMLLGINNRDLSTMTTDLNHTLRMLDLVEDTSILVTESGIRSREDILKLARHGVHIALVGESLMRADDPGAALAALLGRKPG
ncbi:MAG: indole-3-glycerol phosphate synthase TrpC [Phycisphaerales bacterium]